MDDQLNREEAENTVEGLMAALTLSGLDSETLASVLFMRATEMLAGRGYNEDTLHRMVSSVLELQRR